MEYIIFLITMQVPFLYMIWKMNQKHSSKINSNMRVLKKKHEYITNFMDTLRMSIEKISEDIYGSGKVNSRMFRIEKELQELKKGFREMEIYTGLQTHHNSTEDLPSNPLEDRELS